MEPVYRAAELMVRGLAKAQGLQLIYQGKGNLPVAGGAVLAVNHTAYVDFLPSALGLCDIGRHPRYLVKSELMDNALLRFFITHARMVPVERRAGADAYREAVADLRAGEIVVVYPEATISRSFELKEFKTGAVRMAGAAGVPLIPVIVWGSHRQWTKGPGVQRAMGRTHFPIICRYGTALRVQPGDDAVDSESARLHATMSVMLEEVRRDYGEHPAGEFWVPASMGGSAPTLAEANAMDAKEARQRRSGHPSRDDDVRMRRSA